MRPGTFLWFAAHDLLLARRRVRAFFGKAGPVKIALILGAALAVFHGMAWWAMDYALDVYDNGHDALYPTVATIMVFVLPWIVSQALTNATRALYSRGDLDIILASPMPARPVFAARSIAIAFESILSIAIFLLPVANMMAILADPRWLAIYPTLLATGLFGTGLGLVLTLVLFRICGPRRTRIVAQVLATLIGACFAIGLQVFNIAPASFRASIAEKLANSHAGGLLDSDSPIWIPVRAAGGELSALAIWIAISVAVFAAAALMLAEVFARGVVATIGAEAVVSKKPARPPRFRSGVGTALRIKEWRLIARDPGLASQIALQIVYTMPISVVLWRAMGPDGSIALATAPALVAVASNVSASLAWLTISSEDAPEFLATAPVTRAEVNRRKLEAIALPLIVLFSGPVFLIWLSARRGGWITLFYVIAAATSTALLNLWHPAPGRRGDLLRRHSQSKLVGMMEHTLSLFWATALALTAYWSWAAIIPIVFALLLLWANRPKTPAMVLA
jgi:ABC-2 type transport system permease protein